MCFGLPNEGMISVNLNNMGHDNASQPHKVRLVKGSMLTKYKAQKGIQKIECALKRSKESLLPKNGPKPTSFGIDFVFCIKKIQLLCIHNLSRT